MKLRLLKVVLLALSALMLLGAAASDSGQLDWARINPNFEGATFVKDSTVCAGCHDENQHGYNDTAHAKVFQHNARTEAEARECESCHGPRSEHVENPDRSLSLEDASATAQSSVCLQCHESGKMHARSGAHNLNGVACTSCHTLMEQKSEHALLKAASTEETCYQCHSDVRAKMQKVSHHPVREGKMGCADCHDSHGSAGGNNLRKPTLNETCFSCHADKRGPFVWEHAPVRESCANCHDPHGSNNRNLLAAKGGMQCLQCHSYGGHINVPRYNRTSTAYGQGCVNCHVTPHGSNHPSGAKLTR